MKKVGFGKLSCFSRVSRKKGLSPVIASVLMIMLVLVLASMIFLWARGFVSEQLQKFDKPIAEVCATVNFDVARVGEFELEIINRGNVGIRHFEIKMIKGGLEETADFNFDRAQIAPGESITSPVLLFMKDGSVPERIVVYPALLSSVRGNNVNKVFTCIDAGKAI